VIDQKGKNKVARQNLDLINESEEDSRKSMLLDLEAVDHFAKIKHQAHHDRTFDRWVKCKNGIRHKTGRQNK